MSRVQAEETIGRKMYKDSDDREDEPGYLIKYQDGYLSWSPLKVFHETYSLSETYLDRMKIELEEVKKRYLKGREFSMSPQSQGILTRQEFDMLMSQLNAMEKYIYILSQRIYIKEDVPCCSAPPVEGKGAGQSSDRSVRG